MSGRHRIGMVVPVAEDRVPAEGLKMYPDVTFVPRGTGVRSLTPEGFDAAVDKIVPAAEHLAAQDVEAIMLMGTSLTFYRGYDFHQRLLDRARAATGLPVSSMSQSIVDGLLSVGARRVAVGTAYATVINDALADFLAASGLEVLSLESFGITEFGGAASRKSDSDIIQLGVDAVAKAPDAEGLLISCGGLRTLECAAPLEERCNVPVVTSTQSAFWAAMRLVGESGRLTGYGRMLEQAAPPAHESPAARAV